MKSKTKGSKRSSPKKKDEAIDLEEDISFDEADSESDYESSQTKRKSNQRQDTDNSDKSEESTPTKRIKVTKKSKNSTIEVYMNSTLDLSRDLLTPIKSSQLATQWISLFRTNPVDSFKEWLICIFKSVGFKKLPNFNGVNDIKSLDFEFILDGMLQQKPEEKTIWNKPKTNEKKFRSKYERFLKDLILKSKDTILIDLNFLPEWISLLIPLCNCSYRQLRHISTISSLIIGESLLSIIENYKNDIEQFEMNSISNKNNNKKNNNEMKERNINIIENNINYLSENVNMIFNNIFVHRYKDINEVIREECLKYFGKWLFISPSVYIKDNYTKYYGWCLNDIKPKVRQAAVLVLTQLYKNESTLNEMNSFTSHFINRIYNMLNDKDESVICDVLSLLELLYKYSYLEDDKIYKIYELLFVENNKIQNSAINFLINEIYDNNNDDSDNSEIDNNYRIFIRIIDIIDKILKNDDNNNNNIEDKIMNFINSLMNFNNIREILNFNILYNLLTEPKQPISKEYQYYISLILYCYWSILDKFNNNNINNANEDGNTAATSTTIIKRNNNNNINKTKMETEYNEIKKGLKNRIPKLIRSFDYDNKICEILIRMYNVSDIENIICDFNKDEIKIMLKIFEDIYNKKMEDEILIECSKCFYCFYAYSSSCRSAVNKVINEVYQNCVNKILELINDDSDETKVNRDTYLKRLCYLIEYNDIEKMENDIIKELHDYIDSIKEDLKEDDKLCVYSCISIIINSLLHTVMNYVHNNDIAVDSNIITEYFDKINYLLLVYIKRYNNNNNNNNNNCVYDYKLFELYCNLRNACSRNTSVLIKNEILHYKSETDEIESYMSNYINSLILSNKEENEIGQISELMMDYFYVGFNNGSSKEMCLILEKMCKKKEYENKYKEMLNIIKENNLYHYYGIIFKTIEYMYKTKEDEISINDMVKKYMRLLGVGYIKNKCNLFIKALLNIIDKSIKENNIDILKYYGKFTNKISDLDRECLCNELRHRYNDIIESKHIKYKSLDNFLRLLSNEKSNENVDDVIEGDDGEEEDDDELMGDIEEESENE